MRDQWSVISGQCSEEGDQAVGRRPTADPRSLITELGLLGRVVFLPTGSDPGGCCFKTLEDWPGRKVAGDRRACLECGQELKAVLLGDHQQAANDLVACGASPSGAITKEAARGFRVTGTFVVKQDRPGADVERALSRIGASLAASTESEFGWWAGTILEGALLAQAEPGVWLVLQESESP